MSLEGDLIMDFKILRNNNQVHVLNEPSPGVTASIEIANHIIKNFIND